MFAKEGLEFPNLKITSLWYFVFKHLLIFFILKEVKEKFEYTPFAISVQNQIETSRLIMQINRLNSICLKHCLKQLCL